MKNREKQMTKKEALRKTLEQRPDLLEKLELSPEDKKIVAEIEKER